MKLLSSLLLFASLLGCGTASQAPALSTPQAPEAATASLAPQDAAFDPVDASRVVGTWDNSSCGERKFRRQVVLEASGKISGTDFVAPCPPRAQCVWSGIVGWRGTWSSTSAGLSVALEPLAGDSPGSAPMPQSFVIVGEDSPLLAERDGEIVCPYKRAR
ncbi:MAG: hypothetical protein MUC50_02845 [Myxococcota bacterium]|jgi:hypothetical protein|nr:hypothetical protein [Myxococcota bacterium]